jgi:hypothetical protein
VTVKDQDGKIIFSNEKVYKVNNLHFSHNKEGYLGLNNWDITAMDQVNLGIKPHETDSLIDIIPLPENAESITVEAIFRFLYEKGRETVIHREVKKDIPVARRTGL